MRHGPKIDSNRHRAALWPLVRGSCPRLRLKSNCSRHAPTHRRIRWVGMPNCGAPVDCTGQHFCTLEHNSRDESANDFDQQSNSGGPPERNRTSYPAIAQCVDERAGNYIDAKHVGATDPRYGCEQLRFRWREFHLFRPARHGVYAGRFGVHTRDYCGCHWGSSGQQPGLYGNWGKFWTPTFTLTPAIPTLDSPRPRR